jgi:hypothetical protein
VSTNLSIIYPNTAKSSFSVDCHVIFMANNPLEELNGAVPKLDKNNHDIE